MLVRSHVPFRPRLPDAPRGPSGARERRSDPLMPHNGPNRRKGGGRLFVVSNRIPVAVTPDGDGRWAASPASGGLVTALEPVLSRRGGVWVGWPGCPEAGQDALDAALERAPRDPRRGPCRYRAVPLGEEEVEAYYLGFANQVLWPLLHGFSDHVRPRARFWEAYGRVNRAFAERVQAAARWDDLIWVHDYHLMLLGKELRARGLEHRMSFFLHIPFPDPTTLRRIPWERELVEALLHFDLVGFQSIRDRENFLRAVARLHPAALSGNDRSQPLTWQGRTVATGVFPISIDYGAFRASAHSSVVEAMAREIRAEMGDRKLLLGVDRLDYSKGIPEKLEGLDRMFERWPELRGKVVLRQLVVPSRDSIPAYQRIRDEIEEGVEAVNRRWGTGDWTPVEYLYDSWTRSELLAHYRVADVALVTPLNDGMNLVAKEYVAANEGTGALVLSVFAGAAAELAGKAFLVNPSDADSVAGTLVHCLTMEAGERERRMAKAKEEIRSHDVHRWVERFISTGLRVR